MGDKPIPKKVLWVGSARKDLKKFPKPVQSEIGQTLWEVQMGQMPPSVKLKKSKRGAKTPEPDKELIRNRLSEVNKSHRKEKL
ncbi:MAG: hypothetical protein L0220_24620 [Acidobacteria bacterium]|nr:hypothetical protein [Acidobacteriota bacterium]